MTDRIRALAALALPLTFLANIAAADDHRLRLVPYDRQQVVAVQAALGYQLMIEFEPGEHIENVAIGDSVGWQASPNRRGDLLFLKPMDRAPATNMTVATNLRRYCFELKVRRGTIPPDDPDLVYSLRFTYPAPVAPVAVTATATPLAALPPQDLNHAYSYEGSPQFLPARLFDDGKSTYFRFAEGASFPAIFAVEADRSESVVNFHLHDGYLVVDRLARGFVLRRGRDETRIFNDGFREALPDSASPRPRNRTAVRSP